MPFIGKQSSANSKIKKYSYTAEASQQNFAVVSGSGDELQVFFNGVKLKETDDYTYSTSQVTLGAGASAGDIVDIHVFSSFLIADAVSSSTGGPLGTGNNEWSLPVTRASENGQFLQMSDISNGTTAWASTVVDPSITGVTGHLNATESTGEGGGGTLVITGADLGTNISQVTDVSICNSSGGSSVSATTKSLTSSNTEITATWTGNESGYSTFTGVYYVKLTKSGKNSNIFNTTKSFSADPTISSVTGTGGEGESVTVSASDLGTYGGTIAGGGQDSNTKLLLNFDRNGGTDIEDGSNTGSTGHKITASGGAVIKSSPFGDGKSAIRINGSTHKLQMGNSTDFNLGTSACVEFWIYQESTVSPHNIINHGGVGTTDYDGWTIAFQKVTGEDDGISFYRRTSGTSYTLSSGGGYIKTNHWHHVAYTRDGTTARIFIDGKLANSGSDVTATTVGGSNNDLKIGIEQAEGGGRFAGYIDEIRIVNGSPVYTSNFTPPTSRFSASDEANTKLLIHSDKEDDASTNNVKLTKGSGASYSATGKWTGTGSMYFPGGTGNNFMVPAKDWGIGTGVYTMDFWVKQESIANADRHIVFWDAGIYFNRLSATTFRYGTGNNSSTTIDEIINDSMSDFAHVCIVRHSSGNTEEVYINGVSKGSTASVTNSVSTTNNIYFAENQNDVGIYDWKGFISNFRLSKVDRTVSGGDLYNASGGITVPTAKYTGDGTGTGGGVDSNTVLMLFTEGGVFADSATSGTTHTITPTGSYHSQGHGGIAPAMTFPASLKKTGSAGVYFDGTTDYLTIPNSTDFNFSTSAWTIDFFMYPLEINSGVSGGIISSGYEGWANGESRVWLNNDSGTYKLKIYTYGNEDKEIYNIPINTWTHVAISKDSSNNFRVWFDGVAKTFDVGSTTDNREWAFCNSSNGTFIGTYKFSASGHADFKGYIDSFRVQKGVGYSSFTVPTQIYGAMFPRNPSVGTITITGATTDSTDIAFTEINNSLPNGLTLNDQGAGNQTATITGTLTDSVTTDTTTSNIRIQAKANADDKRITEVNESSGTGNVSITKKAGGEPVLFNARRYEGNGAVRDITGLGFQPDLLWGKDRDTSNWHILVDSVRGAHNNNNAVLYSNDLYNADNPSGGSTFSGFNNDGFSLGTNGRTNGDGVDHICWTWKAGGAPSGDGKRKKSNSSTEESLSSGTDYNNITEVQQSVNVEGDFSITKYKGGNGTSNNFFKHGLSGKPDWVIIKRLTMAHWVSWHSSGDSGNADAGDWILLSAGKAWGIDENGNAQTYAFFGDNEITNEKIYLQNDQGWTNTNNTEFICYAWKAVAGVSAFGSFTGNASTYNLVLGFHPKLIILKRANNTGNWHMYDFFRSNRTTNAGASDNTGHSMQPPLLANDSGSEDTHQTNYFGSTNSDSVTWYTSGSDKGVRINTNNGEINGSDDTILYMAFA